MKRQREKARNHTAAAGLAELIEKAPFKSRRARNNLLVFIRLKLYKNIFIYLYNMTKPIDEELAKKVYQRMYYLSLKKKKMIGITKTKGEYVISFK